MHITTQALIFAVASVAAAAAIGTGLAASSAQPAQEIVKLERVVIIGKRADAVQEIAVLPRVVVTGHRTPETEVQVAAN